MSRSRSPAPDASFSELVGIMARLRGPQGCPWDRDQDHRSLRRCLLEEAYEVLEAIDADDSEALRQELGDLLLQVVFHAQLAAEAGRFDIGDVIAALRDKLVGRHPHVFGDKVIETAEAVVDEWEALKREERGETIAQQMAKVPRALPALTRAQIAQRQAGRGGRAVSAEEAGCALSEAVQRLAGGGEAEAEAAVGEMLFAAVDLARAHGVEAEEALRERVERFVEEFGASGSGRWRTS